MQKVCFVLASLGALLGLAYFVHDANASEESAPSALVVAPSTNEVSATEKVEPGAEKDAIQYRSATGVKDGIYEGKGRGFKGDVVVKVAVTNGLITKVEAVKTVDDPQWFDRAFVGVVPRIVETQAVNVDGVSGATYSAFGIKAAVANALRSAGGSHVDEIPQPVATPRGGPGGQRRFGPPAGPAPAGF